MTNQGDSLPLFRHAHAQAPFAVRGEQAVTAAQFLADVAHLVERLPARGHVVNLCADRYHFAVTLAAALLRKQLSLLPPTQAPELLNRLRQSYPDLYAVIDDGAPVPDLDLVRYQASARSEMEFQVPRVPAAQVAALAFTSGSTGQPVPQAKTWGSLVRSARAEGLRLGVDGPTPIGMVGTVPAQHMYGLESTLLLAWHNAAVMHAGKPFFPEDVRAALAQMAPPRMLVTTPVHLRALLSEATLLPQLKLILCATAPLSLELAQASEARFGAPVYEIYGCTEAGQVASRRTVDGPIWQTLPDITLSQRGGDTYAHGGSVEQPTLLQDVIELRDPCHFSLHGRLADLVNIAGKRTSLAHLNHHLSEIDGVRDGTFFLPQEASGSVTRLAAFVVAPGKSPQSIVAALRTRIDAAFLPRPVLMVEALPRNATGKLPREALDALWARLTHKGR